VIAYAFHPDAQAEFEYSALFYESQVAGLGRSFAAEVERTISLVREFPEGILIVAIAHQRRRPGYWRRRK